MENFKMALHKVKDFDSDYRDTFQDGDVVGMSVYSDSYNDEKIGSIVDILVDDAGSFRYFIVDLGFWIFGKKVLLPVGRSRVDYEADRVYVMGLSKEQADHLPEYKDEVVADYDYEEQVRDVYRPGAYAGTDTMAALESSMPLETSTGLDFNTPLDSVQPLATPAATYNRETYQYDDEPSLYGMNEENHQTFKLYEERLIANKNRVKTGEVYVGKHVETETQRVSVPVEKERIVVERTVPTGVSATATAVDMAFQEGEVARLEVYEETPDIRKEAYVAEEVSVRKEIDRETVEAQESIRRERLDIDTQGNPRVG
jgi:uncharacterized protein (TIGR02271 family)